MVSSNSRGRPLNAPAAFIHPCQPTVAKQPPSGPGWAHELKHDGYRLISIDRAWVGEAFIAIWDEPTGSAFIFSCGGFVAPAKFEREFVARRSILFDAVWGGQLA